MRYPASEPSDRLKSLQLIHMLFQAFAFPAILSLPQLALHGRNQALQIRLHDVILSSDLHRGYRGIFANGAGNENERNFFISCSYNFQRLVPAEMRYGVVRNDNVPFLIEGLR